MLARVVIIPKENEPETRELQPQLVEGVRLSFVEKAEQALAEVLL